MSHPKWVRSVLVTLLLSAVSCFAGDRGPEGSQVLDEQLAFDDESFEVMVKPSDVADDIYLDFFLRRRGSPDTKYLFTDSSVLYSRSGDELFSFASDEPKHFGYRLDFSYPSSDRFSPGIIVGPVYNEGTGVGDTINFEWNATTEQCERRVYGIP